MVRSSCISACIIGILAGGSALAQNNDAPASRAGRSSYTVDGLALGARFDAQSPSGRGYQCSPSEQFPEFTRCQRTQRQQSTWGRRSFDSISSILHGGDGKAVYVNHYVGPWVFDRNEIQTEINRLSSRFGERAREMRMPQREGLPSGIIASWGQVALEQLRIAGRNAFGRQFSEPCIDAVGRNLRSCGFRDDGECGLDARPE